MGKRDCLWKLRQKNCGVPQYSLWQQTLNLLSFLLEGPFYLVLLFWPVYLQKPSLFFMSLVTLSYRCTLVFLIPFLHIWTGPRHSISFPRYVPASTTCAFILALHFDQKVFTQPYWSFIFLACYLACGNQCTCSMVQMSLNNFQAWLTFSLIPEGSFQGVSISYFLKQLNLVC